VTLSEAVTVTGSPALALETGTVDRNATYTGGSGSSTLGFTYTVQAGDVSGDLDYRNATSLGGGAIADAVGNPANLALPTPGTAGSLGANKDLVIDGVAPVVTITAPADGASIGPRVTFTWTVDDGSAPLCQIDSGPATACTSGFATNLPAGSHTFTVTATDGAGNTGSDTNSFTVVCGPQTGGPMGHGLFHMEETSGQILENSIATTLDALLGRNSSVETEDPTRIAGGRFGRAIAFDEVENDTASWLTAAVGGPSFTLHDHTVELWARMTAGTAGEMFVSGDFRLKVFYTNASGQVRFGYSLVDDAGATQTVTSAAMPAGVFHHVVATYTGTTMTLWVDGVAVTGNATITGLLTMGVVMFSAPNSSIDGILDEIYLGRQALTSAEVLVRYCPL
jgi:hypothetical protein